MSDVKFYPITGRYRTIKWYMIKLKSSLTLKRKWFALPSFARRLKNDDFGTTKRKDKIRRSLRVVEDKAEITSSRKFPSLRSIAVDE